MENAFGKHQNSYHPRIRSFILTTNSLVFQWALFSWVNKIPLFALFEIQLRNNKLEVEKPPLTGWCFSVGVFRRGIRGQKCDSNASACLDRFVYEITLVVGDDMLMDIHMCVNWICFNSIAAALICGHDNMAAPRNNV